MARVVRGLVLALVASLVAAAPALAQTAYVAEVAGTVTLTRGGATRAVALGETLVLSDLVEVGEDGALEIAFEDGTTAEAVAGARLRIAALSPRLTRIGLERGALRSIVERRGRVSYEVRTPVATAGVRGTDFGVEYPGDDGEDGEAAIDVFEGEVEVEPAPGTTWTPQRLRAGESARARLRRALLKRRIPEERRRTWEERRERFRDRIRDRIDRAIEAGRSREEIYRHLPQALRDRFRERAKERFDRARDARERREEARREEVRERRRESRRPLPPRRLRENLRERRETAPRR